MEYLPVLMLLVAAGALGGIIVLVSYLLGPKIPHKRKDMPFECGVPTLGTADQRFSVRFYLVAILFLLFDVEVLFLYPWAVVYREYLSVNAFIVSEMLLFVAVVLVGYIYVLKKGALEWE